jgi:hypothetical protein
MVVLAGVAVAVRKDSPAVDNGLESGTPDVSQLYMFPSTAGVDITEWGKMLVNGNSNIEVMNAHGLVPSESYALIGFFGRGALEPCQFLGTETSNNGGNLHIAGAYNGYLCKSILVRTSDLQEDCFAPLYPNPVLVSAYSGSVSGCD